MANPANQRSYELNRIHLSESERQTLETEFKSAKKPRIKERYQAILMAARGRSHTQIAEDLSVSERTLRRWLSRYRKNSVDGLTPGWRGVKKPLIPEDLAPEIIEWVRKGPSGCGLERANWSFAELAAHLYRIHGIKVSETTMRDFCHRHDIHPYRPTYLYMKADPQKQETAKEELAGLKKRSRGK